MKKSLLAAMLAAAYPWAPAALAQSAADDIAVAAGPVKELGVVTVTGLRPTSLPTQIPTTFEGMTREDIERTVNATDSEDALKYLPSLLVRKRYIGDYNHAILSSRASGTGNSARSAVYGDGILLSNYLGNGVGGLSFPPRWGLVTPEEIDRVDVMYGPFSAAYPGNSVGAVVDYVTRMPTKFEAHASVGTTVQPFKLYQTNETFRAWQTSASLGNRAGAWSWWLNVNHTDSEGQPLTFPTRLLSRGVAGGTAGTPVTGAVLGADNANNPWFVLGTGTQYHTKQDHLKVKLAYDFSPTMRASYVLGVWQNDSEGHSKTYLRDANGQPVFSGPVNIGGIDFVANPPPNQTLTGGDFAETREDLRHFMHGLSLKTNTKGEWDWEVAASLYDYDRDHKRQNSATNVQPGALSGGPGTIADGSGTGWNTLGLRGTWRPPQAGGAHVVDFGVQRDSYELRYLTSGIAGNWLADGPGNQVSNVRGDTRLQSLWAQDAWRLSDRWKTVLGLRTERWEAFNGLTDIAGAPPIPPHPARHETHFSPKAALAWEMQPDTVLKWSLGRAVRFPTVAELYGATLTTNAQFINDPNLRPEKSWTTELSAEKEFDGVMGRLTFFGERTRDALYSQTILDPIANRNVSRVQNVDRIDTKGLEVAANTVDWMVRGLSLSGSLTYADSKIKENSGFVATPGDTIGKRQPNIPRWRATAVASYRLDEHWTGTLAARYSGRQYRTLNNADVNGYTYQGVSKFATVDLRVVYRFNKQWSAAFGIDNLNNYEYWNFHPYPQRSYSAELKFDL